MKKLVFFFLGIVILGCTARYAYAVAYRMDFNGDEVWDTTWIIEPPPGGATAQVDVWLDQNYECPPDDNLFGLALYFQYDPEKIAINQIVPNDADNGGPFDPDFTILTDPACEDGVCYIELAHFLFITLVENRILLFTMELEALDTGVVAVQAAGNVGPPFDDGFCFDCNVVQQFPNYGAATIYLVEEDSDNDTIKNDGDNNTIPGDHPCVGGQTANCDDNCPYIANLLQEDSDSDAIGNACDNCPDMYNPDQADAGDGDGAGTLCDNCLTTPNGPNLGTCFGGIHHGAICTQGSQCAGGLCQQTQEDGDADGLGDVCDNCPAASNPTQDDFDDDMIGDICDNCTDTDHDGYGNPGFSNTCDEDNCPNKPNGPLLGTCLIFTGGVFKGTTSTCATIEDCDFCDLNQWDYNANNIGDACECYADATNDGKVNLTDLGKLKAEFGRTNCTVTPVCIADANGDNKVNLTDLSLLKAEFGKTNCPIP